jgi:hypothetical protein
VKINNVTIEAFEGDGEGMVVDPCPVSEVETDLGN